LNALRFKAQFNEDGSPVCTSIPLNDSIEVNPEVSIGKDSFRGYTPAQRRKLLQENEYLRAIKQAQVDQEKRTEADWAMHQAAQLRAMEQAHYDEMQMKKFQDQQCYDTLKRQAEEQSILKEQRNKERMGSISSDFFNNFGKSCR
jgi:hypothetical protein